MPHECTGCRRVFPDGSKEMLSGCPDCGGNKFQFRPSGTVEPGEGGADGVDAAADGAPAEEPPEPQAPGGGVAETVAGATERVRSLVSSDDADDGAPPADPHEWPAVGREDGTDAASAAEDGTDAARAAEDATAAGEGGIRADTAGTEDTAQASARSGVVDSDELPDPPEQPAADASDDLERPTAGPPAADEPDSAAGAEGPSPADATGEAGSAPFTGNGDREEEQPDLSELREELNDQFESIRIVDRGQYELNLMELYDREEYIISLLEDGRYAIEVPETWRDD